MTREEATRRMECCRNFLANNYSDMGEPNVTAFNMAIKALENIGHLTDRPCDVCEFHKEDGCCKWTCVFTDRLFGDMR